MSKLNPSDIQGFTLRGYNLPFARYLFLQFHEPDKARALLTHLLPQITTGQRWDRKPDATLNIAFTHRGLTALELPLATLISFPPEFQLGMKARANILGDVGRNAHQHWDEVWRVGKVHAWLAINAQSPAALETCFAQITALLESTHGASLLDAQDAGAIPIDGKFTSKEHFGYTDGFGNPDYLDICRDTQPGQGKLMKDGTTWTPLATGELLLGYADEAGELPVMPVPHLLGSNGTFMVYRKLHQNVGTFREFLAKWSDLYAAGDLHAAGDAHAAGDPHGAGDPRAREKLAAKFIGRWRDGTPIELSPDHPDQAIVQDRQRNVNFMFGDDPEGTRCPVGAHVRRTNPRDAFGFHGELVHRRRISRRRLVIQPLRHRFHYSTSSAVFSTALRNASTSILLPITSGVRS